LLATAQVRSLYLILMLDGSKNIQRVLKKLEEIENEEGEE
jgi:hypothetical protein